ncbi:alpha/beta fold hydrolase [Ralstonia sp. 1B3]|uniref:alpha/beta fold hydrolase n=1 Tax=Ralstonia sp. 1B3 TaxID=2997421 RepID=UPI003FA77294
MRKLFAVLALMLAMTRPVQAQVKPYPPGFRHHNIQTDGATLFVRVGGSGPAVVLLHGFGDTGDMWAPLAAELARTHTVVVPDLRGMGLSSHPEGGYDKRTQAGDIRAVLTKLNIDQADVVGHDIGTMVAFAYAARYPDKTTRLVVMDAPCRACRRGSRSSVRPSSGTSPSAAPMPSGSSKAASASTSTASGMSLPAPLPRSTKPRARTTRASTPSRVPCIQRLRSSCRSRKTRRTTRNPSLPSCPCRCSPSAAPSRSARTKPSSCATPPPTCRSW